MTLQGSRKLFVACRFKRLATKYLAHKDRERRLGPAVRLRKLARRLLARHTQRRALCNLSGLARRLLVKHHKVSAMKAIGRWKKLIDGLQRRDGPGTLFQYTALERWEILLGKVLDNAG